MPSPLFDWDFGFAPEGEREQQSISQMFAPSVEDFGTPDLYEEQYGFPQEEPEQLSWLYDIPGVGGVYSSSKGGYYVGDNYYAVLPAEYEKPAPPPEPPTAETGRPMVSEGISFDQPAPPDTLPGYAEQYGLQPTSDFVDSLPENSFTEPVYDERPFDLMEIMLPRQPWRDERSQGFVDMLDEDPSYAAQLGVPANYRQLDNWTLRDYIEGKGKGQEDPTFDVLGAGMTALDAGYQYGGKQALGVLTGAGGMERKPIYNERGDIVGYEREGGQGLSDWLRNVGTSIKDPMAAGEAYDEYSASLPLVGQIAARTVADPTSYLGAAGLSKVGVGGFAKEVLDTGGGAAVLGGALGGGLADEYLPEDMPFRTAAVLGAGLAGGVGGALGAQGVKAAGRNIDANIGPAIDELQLNPERGSVRADMGLGGEDLDPVTGKPVEVLEQVKQFAIGQADEVTASQVDEAIARAGGDGGAPPVTPPVTSLDAGDGLPPKPPAVLGDGEGLVPEEPDRFVSAKQALADKGEVFESAWGSNLPTPLRKVVALFNPAADMDETVQVANRANRAVANQLHSEFAVEMNPVVRRVKAVLAREKPEYIGPAPKTEGQRRLIGTEKDILERPSMYTLSDDARAAIREFGAEIDRTAAKVREQYGVDVGVHKPLDPDGVFVPTVVKERFTGGEVKLDRASKDYGMRSTAKPREYDSAWDRAAVRGYDRDTFVTDIAELAELHSRAVANMAGNETFKLGLGGKTRLEMLRMTHPGAMKARDIAERDVANLRRKLRNAEKRAGINTKASDELDKVLDEIDARVPEDIGKVAKQPAELRRQAARADQLNRRADEIMFERGERELKPGEQPKSDTLPKTKIAEAKGIDRVVAAIDKLVPEDVERVRFLDNAITRSYRRADELAKRGGRYADLAEEVKAQLDEAKTRLEVARHAVEVANPARGTDYVLSNVTYRYHPEKVVKGIEDISRSATGLEKAIYDTADEIRGIHFAGDGSPLTQQGTLGVMARPVQFLKGSVAALYHPAKTAEAVWGFVQKDAQQWLDEIAREFPDDVKDFTFSMNRPWLTPTPELGTGKGLARVPGFKGAEQHMWARVQVQGFHMWKNLRDQLLDTNAGLSRNAANHAAAEMVQKAVPGRDTTIRALSPRRAALERSLITSVSFATTPAQLTLNATKGLAKFGAMSLEMGPEAAWKNLTPKDQAAVKMGVGLASSLATISVGTAIASAESRNMSIEDAIKEQFDPKSPYFLSIQLGEGRKVGLGGPFRSFTKAMLPGENGIPMENFLPYLKAKLNSPIATALDLSTSGQDWAGNKIFTGKDMGENILRGLWYVAEANAPTTVGEVSEALRTGERSISTIAERAGSQLLGTNYSPPSKTERMSQDYRELETPYKKPDNVYDDPLYVKKWAMEHPDDSARTSEVGKKLDAIDREFDPQYQANDADAMADGRTLVQWREVRDDLGNERRGAVGRELDKAGEREVKEGTPRHWVESWYGLFDQATKAGLINSEELGRLQAEWRAQHKDDGAWEYIKEYEKLGDSEMEREYQASMDQLEADGYWDMKKYIGMISGKTDREIDALRSTVDNEVLKNPWMKDLDYEDKALLTLRKQGVDIKTIIDVGNAGKQDYQHPRYEMYRETHKHLFTWFNPDATYSTYKALKPK